MNIHELSRNESILLILQDGLGVFSIVVTAIGHFLEVYCGLLHMPNNCDTSERNVTAIPNDCGSGKSCIV